MEISLAVTDVPLFYKEPSCLINDGAQHKFCVGETETQTHPNGNEGTDSTFQQILGTKRRTRWQSRTCSSALTNGQQQHTGISMRNEGFLLRLGLLSILLHLCSGFALLSVPHQHHHNVYTTRYSSHSRQSRLYAIETEPSSRVGTNNGELAPLPLKTYYDGDENKLSRRLFPEEIQGTALAQEEDIDDLQEDGDDDDDDSDKEIIMDDEDDDEDDVEMASKRLATLKRAALLGRKSGAGYRSTARASAKEKSTSVGERKVGSATKARRGLGATSRILDTVRKTALGVSAAAEKKRNSDKEEPTNSVKGVTTTSQIHSTIEGILKMRRASVHKPPTREEDLFSAAISSIGRGMGIFGETKSDAFARRDESQVGKAMLDSSMIDTNDIMVRPATSSDDVAIACLRLSVFSDISPDLQNQFVSRSCHAIANRRLRGAKCVVATVPGEASGSRTSHLLGSAECSFHEFFSTKLGQRRPQHSILYVTEFAVNPVARRKGIGFRLIDSLQKLALAREAETLYLHVDVTNREAISLYEKAGYRQVVSDDPMYMEFTASLNLHPGATKGRVHHLYYKDLIGEPTWLPDGNHNEYSTATTQNESMVGNLGFVVP